MRTAREDHSAIIAGTNIKAILELFFLQEEEKTFAWPIFLSNFKAFYIGAGREQVCRWESQSL